jgi:hypothetical protein
VLFLMFRKFLIAAFVLALASGIACADTGCPQVPETQGFATSTIMQIMGTVTETDSIVSQITSLTGTVNGQPSGVPPTPPLAFVDHEYYVDAYAEDTIADQGLVTYTKTLTTDTAGMITSDLYNLQAEKVVEFVGSDLGRMTSEESNTLDGASTGVEPDFSFICPFLSSAFTFTPPFCTIVEQGSAVDLTTGSLATRAQERHIMQASGDVGVGEIGPDLVGVWSGNSPVSDPGTEAGYGITLTGIGDIPASGSASAYITVHIQEAGGNSFGVNTAPNAEDLSYAESSTASGEITLFSKETGYTSLVTGNPPQIAGT